MVARGGGRKALRMSANGYGVSFWGKGNLYNETMATTTQLVKVLKTTEFTLQRDDFYFMSLRAHRAISFSIFHLKE